MIGRYISELIENGCEINIEPSRENNDEIVALTVHVYTYKKIGFRAVTKAFELNDETGISEFLREALELV